jgi:hypothetical protein
MLSCPKCKFVFDADELSNLNYKCLSCRLEMEIIPFPALYKSTNVYTRVLAEENSATCAFHKENQADAVCTHCGRLICSICKIPLGNKTVCPQCIDKSNTIQTNESGTGSIAWDSLALILVCHPLLLFFWFLTFFSALASITISIINWNKRINVVTTSKKKFLIAIILSIGWIAAWIIGIYLVTNVNK